MRRLFALLALLPSLAFGQSAAYNLSQLSHSLLSGGIVPYTNGGTGLTTLTANDCLVVNATATGFIMGTCGGGGGGSVSSFGFTNGSGFTGTVTNSTTTPALSLSLVLTGDCATSGASITCTKTSGTAFSALATTVPGTGVATALGVNVGSAGAVVVNGGPLGTPSSGTATNLTGTATGLTAGLAQNLTGSPAITVSSCTGCGSGGSVTLQTNGTNNTSQTTLNLENGQGVIVSNPSAGNVSVSTTVPTRTVTTSPTVASTDMGGIILMNVTGGGTLTIPAIGSGVFGSGQSLFVVNYSASTATISTTPTINAGGGCVSGTGIPAGDTWQLISNGTTLDCAQTTPTSSGGSGTPGGSANSLQYQATGTTFGGLTLLAGQVPVWSGTGSAPTASYTLNLGSAGVGAGSVVYSNLTSGSITVTAPTGALGTVNLTWPTVSGGIPSLGASQTWTGTQAIASVRVNGTSQASASLLNIVSAPFTAGTSTTNWPLVYLSPGATAPTTWSTAGTMFGENAPSGFTGNLMDFHVNGGASVAKLDASGNLTVASCSGCTSGGGGTVTSVGLSLPAGWSVSGSPVTTSGTLTAAFSGPVVGGTKFTAVGTGCTVGTTTGGATAGTLTLAAGPCTSVVITMNGATGLTAPNGWHCNVGDRTLQNAGTWFGEWPESSSTTTTATIAIPSAAGATDVITFNCTGY